MYDNADINCHWPDSVGIVSQGESNKLSARRYHQAAAIAGTSSPLGPILKKAMASFLLARPT